MNQYRAIYVVAGSIRRITFEAANLEEARRLATTWGFGLEGEAPAEISRRQEKDAAPAAVDARTACRLLGGISRAMLYRHIARKILHRLPDTRKILVTRASIERYCARAA